MTIGSSLLGAAGCLAAGILVARAAPRVWLALILIAAALGLGAALTILTTGGTWDWHSEFLVGGQVAHLWLDGLSAWFLALLAVGGAAGAIYARGYWNDQTYPRSAGRGRVWWNALLLSMGMLLLCSNGLHFLIAWELFAISGYFLITLERTGRQVRAAGWLYLAASHAGTLGLFAFFALLSARTGSWELGPMRDHPELAPLFWIALVGFGVKAGLFPLHIWLPSAHANAPSHVSAILSGVAIKMGIYGILRFGGWLPTPVAAGWTVMAIGAVTALLGIAFALGQNDLKRLLAYSSVENIGIILVGVGGGLLGLTHPEATWGRLALAGALLHVWNHGAFKSLLFYGAGSVVHGTGTREMSRLGGLWRTMPWTAGLFSIGALSVSALPPFNGFVSEWLIYLGLFDAVTSHTSVAWIAMTAAIMLGITGAMALAAFIKAAGTIFLGAPRTPRVTHAHESDGWMRGPMIALAGLCAALGLGSALLWPLILHAVAAWHPGWDGPVANNPVAILGPVQLGLATAAVIAGFALWRLVARRGVVRQLTWDCGYAQPIARMQYTSGSLGGIPSGWFAWILQPERQLQRPRGFFPGKAHRIERVPETVLEKLLGPASRLILQVSTAVRRLQHGRLQYYIAYVVVALVGLTALVATGAKR